MAIQTVNGGCVHIEIIGGFVTTLTQGIEVLVPIADPDDEEDDD